MSRNARQKTTAVPLTRYPIPNDTSDGTQHDQTLASEMDCTEEETASAGHTSMDEDISSEEEVDDNVAEEMGRFLRSFKDLEKSYKLINKIGEGTFSSVYKAEDLNYDYYNNPWDIQNKSNSPYRTHKSRQRPKPRYVAIKKIYVTSSPIRIYNELELLADLRGSDAVCPLITAVRHHDQVLAVLPYFQHQDFRDYFKDMKVHEMRPYFKALFTGLAAVHKRHIIHRDIKPTNFLYNPAQEFGVLVDFGLAERQHSDYTACVCEMSAWEREHRTTSSAIVQGHYEHLAPGTYPKSDRDTRPSRRANRAGTRGFRAPEVLFKCTAQTTAIDVWSAGVILLTLLGRRFPFFHSADDVDALLEMTQIWGKRKMREAALMHGCVMETTIPSYREEAHSLEKIVLWSCGRYGDKEGKKREPLTADEEEAVEFLNLCLELDPQKRITAQQALRHPFIAGTGLGAEDEDEINTMESEGMEDPYAQEEMQRMDEDHDAGYDENLGGFVPPVYE